MPVSVCSGYAGILLEQFFAHSVSGSPESTWEPLHIHLDLVAARARSFAQEFGSADWGEIAGWWHDLGKYRPEFQQRIRGIPIQAAHAGVGAALAEREKLGAIALVVAGHHAGLANAVERLDSGPRPLREVIEEARPWLEAIERAGHIPPRRGMRPAHPQHLIGGSPSPAADLWVRMLFSALVDADRIETEGFYEPGKRAFASGTPLNTLRDRLDTYLDGLPSRTPVDGLRREILACCRAVAASPPGVFSLTVPTGGGKTYSSMAFALHHGAIHDLRRVVVVAPFTSIIDQNAREYRLRLGDANVLEHHSNVRVFDDKEQASEAEARRRLLAENWDAPIVVTTAVQFLESLFANDPSRCRKLHNLVGSVIVLDEAQTLPIKFLLPVLDVLRELARAYRCTLVFTTATQPALERRDALPEGFADMREIMDDPVGLAHTLRRVTVQWPEPGVITTYEEVATAMTAASQALAVVHARADARELAEFLPSRSRLHLSTRMCPAHRLEVLARVRNRLAQDRPCHLVSTQLIEAGVDVDFPLVFRAMAGLDSLAQAAGRCNRNGRLTEDNGVPRLGDFVVFRAPTRPPSMLWRALQISEAMLAECIDGGRELDLLDPTVHEEFFRRLYRTAHLDETGIVSLYGGHHLATIARRFRLIDDGDQEGLVVPYGHAGAALSAFEMHPDRGTARRLQPFTVNLRTREVEVLHRMGALRMLDGYGHMLSAPYLHLYHPEFGLLVDEETPADSGALMI